MQGATKVFDEAVRHWARPSAQGGDPAVQQLLLQESAAFKERNKLWKEGIESFSPRGPCLFLAETTVHSSSRSVSALPVFFSAGLMESRHRLALVDLTRF